MPLLNRLKRPPIDKWPFEIELFFPKGLLGFETHTLYHLRGYQKEKPFLRLEAKGNHYLSFYVVDPFISHPAYEPTLTKQDMNEVGVIHEAKLILLAIVNTKETPLTMNLAAPLLIHWHKRKGKQLLMHQDPAYPFSVD